jgi:hypothetical protein
VLPSRTTPTLQKKTPSTPAEELELNTAEPEVTPLPPVKAKPKGEQFDYNKVWNLVVGILAIPKLMSGLGTSVKKCPN